MNIEKATEFLRKNNLAYWRVEHSGKTCARSNEAEDGEKGKTELNLEDSISFFQESMDMHGPGIYKLIARKSAKGHNGEMTFPFSIKPDQPAGSVPQVGYDAIGTVVKAEMQAVKLEYELKFRELQHQQEVRELKKQIKEAKEGGEEGWDKFNKAIGNIMSLINAGKAMQGAPAGVAGTRPAPGPQRPQPVAKPAQPPISGLDVDTVEEPEVTEVPSDPDDEARLSESLEKLYGVLGDHLIPAMQSLANYGQQNPDQIKSFLEFLNNSQPGHTTYDSL
jgi:hypothetical protein